MWRRQPPSWSPVAAGTIWRGLADSRTGDSLMTCAAMLAEESGASRVVLTASGTAALTLAMAGSRVGRPRVALPAWGCPDLATAADGADASVLLYDLDPRTLGPDLDSLARVLRHGVDAIVVAHFFGVPVDIDALRPLGSAAGGLLIDDAAQGVGARWRGRPLGSSGDLGVLSFGRGKGRTGGGGGALLVTSEPGGAAVDRIDATVAPAAAAAWPEVAALVGLWLLARPSLYRIPASIPFLRLGESIYHPPRPLRRMKPLTAAVLVAGQPAVELESSVRRQTGLWWLEHLRDHHQVTVIDPTPDADPGWLRFPVIVPPARIAQFASPEMRGLGVMPGYPLPLARLAGFDRRIEAPEPRRWPGAEFLARQLFTLPTHGRLVPGDRERLLRLIQDRGSR